MLTPMEMGDGEQPEQVVRGRQHAPRSKQQRERSYSRLGVAWLVLQFAAAAAFSLDHGGRIHSPALEGGDPWSASRGSIPQEPCSSFGPIPTLPSPSKNYQITLDDIFGGRTWQSGVGTGGLRPGDGHEQHVRPAGSDPQQRPGKLKRLKGDLDRYIKMVEHQVMTLEHLPPWKDQEFNTDLMELFAGKALATTMAREYGLTAVQPFEVKDGYNLYDKNVRGLCDLPSA